MQNDHKTCKGCGETKPLSSFSKHRGYRDGLNSKCKRCYKEYLNSIAHKGSQKKNWVDHVMRDLDETDY